MVELNQIVNSEAEIEKKPYDDDGSEHTSNLRGSQRLNQEENDKNRASDADNCSLSDGLIRHREALNSAKDGLSRCQNAIWVYMLSAAIQQCLLAVED